MTPKMNQPEERLSAALRELAASSRQSASPELGLVLNDAFRRHHTHRRRMLRMRTAILCICMASLAGSLLLKRPALKNGETVVHTIPPQEVTYTAESSSARNTMPLPPRRRSPNRTATQTNGFVALPSFAMLPAGDELRVVRLEMPREYLRLVGGLEMEKLAGRRVTADFVVGHDGTPYAMRLVQSKY
jgi:hypothetical protein